MPAILLKPKSLGPVRELESLGARESHRGSGRELVISFALGRGYPMWAWLEQSMAPDLIPMSPFSQLPFEKNCGADHICQDDLGIIFGFPK